MCWLIKEGNAQKALEKSKNWATNHATCPEVLEFILESEKDTYIPFYPHNNVTPSPSVLLSGHFRVVTEKGHPFAMSIQVAAVVDYFSFNFLDFQIFFFLGAKRIVHAE